MIYFKARKKHDGIKSQNYDITGEEGKEKKGTEVSKRDNFRRLLNQGR